MYSLFISTAKGLEYLLERELTLLGLQITRVSPQGVYGICDLTKIYQLCLWSRLANRIHVILFSGEVVTQQELYQLCYLFPWPSIFSPEKTFAIDFHGSSPELNNTMFGAQVIKDAIVDYFQAHNQCRPSVDKKSPQIRLHAHLKNQNIMVSLDVTGHSMHQRGYRTAAGQAPLKENIAAAVLMRAKWPELAKTNAAIIDPCCGSGTLIIEAAMMAANMAPGLLRNDQLLQNWLAHQPSLWDQVRTDAASQAIPTKCSFYGSDQDSVVIAMACANAKRAGVADLVDFSVKPLINYMDSHNNFLSKGLLICNPPYGERLEEEAVLIPLYQQLGAVLHQSFQGWDAAILTSSPILAKATGLRANKQYTFYNGALKCQLYCMSLDQSNRLKTHTPDTLSNSAIMLANRLKKNSAHLKKWAKRNEISCYRLYDGDIPEYAYAIDIYNEYAVLQEYMAPKSVPAHKVEEHRLDVLKVVPDVLNLSADQWIVKQRQQQKGLNQYQKINHSKCTMVVTEGQAKFHVNLYDYLDTGLFLDHRILRLRFAKLPNKIRFLNCFCYTASASVHAALAGASTTNIDLSKTYLNWARDNFTLNNLDLSRHNFIHANCLEWLQQTNDKFDVIYLDPPSFSNSKRMNETFDVQRDHEGIIILAMQKLNPNGTLYFSTNFRRFKLAASITAQFVTQDISAETIDLDFKRNERIHHCFIIRWGT